MLNIKISLVTSSGLLLASKPEVADDTRQILTTGLMTALISFSKEVHHRELQSISYQDRTVSFIRVHEFVLILETFYEESVLSETQLGELLEKLQSCIAPILDGVDPDKVTEGEAAIILDRCLHDVQLPHYSITEQPLQIAESTQFTLIHSKKGWEIEDEISEGSYITLIAQMLDSLKVYKKCKNQLTGILTHLPDQNRTVYIIVDTDGQKSKVGVIKTPRELDWVLFRLATMMNDILKEMSQSKKEVDMQKIIDTLKNVDDPGNWLSRIDLDDLSPSFLERTVGKSLDKVIYSAIVGDSIFVIGDKPTVKLVIDTLSIFTQHIQNSVNVWITKNDLVHNGKCDLSAKMCGMSSSVFDSLVEDGFISEKDTIVNIVTGKINGTKSSTSFKRLYDTIKKLSVAELVTKIELELEKLVSFSLELTTISLVDENKGKAKLKELNSKSGYSNSFVRKALELAVKRNILLDYLL